MLKHMKAPEYIPPVLDELQPIETTTLAQDNLQSARLATESAVQGFKANIAGRLEYRAQQKAEKIDHKKRFYEHLGNLAVGRQSGENVKNAAGNLPQPRTAWQRRKYNKAADAGIGRYLHDATVGPGFTGNPAKGANRAARIGIHVNTAGLNKNEKALALHATHSKPVIEESRYDKKVRKDVKKSTKDKGLRPSASKKRAEKYRKISKEARERKERTEVAQELHRSDRQVNKAIRHHDKGVDKTNNHRSNYIKRVGRAARLDKTIKATESGDAINRRTKARLKSTTVIRNTNELLIQRSERRGANLRTDTERNRTASVERARQEAQRSKDSALRKYATR